MGYTMYTVQCLLVCMRTDIWHYAHCHPMAQLRELKTPKPPVDIARKRRISGDDCDQAGGEKIACVQDQNGEEKCDGRTEAGANI